MVETTKVEGEKDEHDVKIYTLSTCGWCKKTKKFLKEHGVEYEYIDIDLLEGDERKEIMEEFKEYNPKKNCPTIVVDEGETVIVGYMEDKIKEVLC
ncbi:MAG: glutaredoxin family protein [Candidatus Saliniplasma sp.]